MMMVPDTAELCALKATLELM